jgi:uncharacterized membrane protein
MLTKEERSNGMSRGGGTTSSIQGQTSRMNAIPATLPGERPRRLLFARSSLQGRNVFAAVVVAALILDCVLVSANKEPWADEVITLRILTLPTWSEMWSAVADQIGHMPFYFLVARLWADLVGPSLLSFRLFSSLAIAAAFVILWITLRPSIGTRSIALAIGAVTAFSPALLDQNAEVRFYGMFFLAVAAAFYTFDRSDRHARPAPGLLAADGAIHAVVVLTHVFGVLFSLLILAARLWRDLATARLRLRVYGAQLAGMAAFLLWLAPLHRQSAPLKPHYIHSVPTLYDLARVTTVELHDVYFSLALILALAALAAIARPAAGVRPSAEPRRRSPTETPAFAFAVALSLAPVLTYVYSKVGTPVLVARYLLPTLIAWTILIAFAAEELVVIPIWSAAAGTLQRGLALVFYVVVGALFLLPAVFVARQPQQHGYGAVDSRFIDYGLPIVVENDVAYMARSWNGPRPELYYYLLDWETAMFPKNERNATVGFQLQLNSKAHFPDLNIMSYENFLAETPRFLVADAPTNLWAERRLLNNPAYRVTSLGPITGSSFNETMLLVERIAPAQQATQP